MYGWRADLITPQRAVIKESLRLSYGIPGRIPRVVPEGGGVLCGRAVAAGVGAVLYPMIFISVRYQSCTNTANHHIDCRLIMCLYTSDEPCNLPIARGIPA